MSGGPAPAPSSELGKRKNRWGEDEYDAPAPGCKINTFPYSYES